MAVLPMKKISIYGLKRNRKQILELIQRRGVIEIKNDKPDDSGIFSKTDTKQAIGQFESSIKSLKNAVSTLDSIQKPEGGLLSSLSGKKEITLDEWNEIAEGASSVLKTASRINNCAKKIADSKSDKVKYETQIESLKPWVGLDVSMRTKETDS